MLIVLTYYPNSHDSARIITSVWEIKENKTEAELQVEFSNSYDKIFFNDPNIEYTKKGMPTQRWANKRSKELSYITFENWLREAYQPKEYSFIEVTI